jgi:enolase
MCDAIDAKWSHEGNDIGLTFTAAAGDRAQIVGDDLFVTNDLLRSWECPSMTAGS